MKYPFSYVVRAYKHWDETYYEQCGMGICNGYADAISIIEKQYGDELISVKHLELHEEGSVIIMPHDTMKAIINDFYEGVATYEVQLSETEAKCV